jgi:AraC family transcriptional regulator
MTADKTSSDDVVHAQARRRGAHTAAYAQRMNKVLDHIDACLDGELDLPTLADVAHFSPFHFHRLFMAWMGETLGDYLRRRRLETAAVRLAAIPALPVLDVAVSVGFGSGEAFARAFKLRFGETPTVWRRTAPQRWAADLQAMRRRRHDSNADQLQRNPDQAARAGLADDEALTTPEFPMKVTIETLAPARMAYLRHIGPYGQPVSQFWLQTVLPWLIANGLEQAPRYGVGLDDPCITEPGQCRYDAGVAIPDDFVARNPAGIQTLPGGRYAITDFEGTVDDIAATYTELLRDWLPASGLQADDRPFYEYYPADALYDAEKGTFQCRICLAVHG